MTKLKQKTELDGFELDNFLPYLLNRVVNRLNQSLASDLKAIGLTAPQYRVLAVLKARDGRNVNELAVYTVTEQSTLTKILGRMEDTGLIERRPDRVDRRVVNIFLTAKGDTAFNQVLPVALKHYDQAIEGLDDTAHQELIAALHKILGNVRVSPFP